MPNATAQLPSREDLSAAYMALDEERFQKIVMALRRLVDEQAADIITAAEAWELTEFARDVELLADSLRDEAKLLSEYAHTLWNYRTSDA